MQMCLRGRRETENLFGVALHNNNKSYCYLTQILYQGVVTTNSPENSPAEPYVT